MKQQIQTIELYTPHRKQFEAHLLPHRFRVLSFGRQSGKSTWANNELLKHAWAKPNTVYWFVSPTYKQAKKMYRRMKKAIQKNIGMWRKNDSELIITLKNGSTIQYVSGEVYDNLRGETLHGCVIDEVRDQNKNLWARIIRPMLTSTKGWCAFVGTPNGFDHFYDLSLKALTNKNWAFLNAPSTCNPAFTKEEYDDAKRDMTLEEFEQEIEAQFRSLTQGQAYKSFNRERNIREIAPWMSEDKFHPFMPIELYLDFNVDFISWTYGQYKEGVGHYFRDEIRMSGNTELAALEFVSRFKTFGIRAEIGVNIVGDASGKSRKTSADIGATDYTILCDVLKDNGITYRNLTPESNPPVKDRVNTVNARLYAADKHTELWVHPDCQFAIKDFERVLWKEGSQKAILDQTKDPSLTHSTDGIGYGVCVRNPIKGTGNVGILRRIRRA